MSHSNSFYRNDFDKKKRDFFGGIERNLQRIQTDFPGSVMRLYYQVPNESLFLQTACKLACTVPNFDLCDVERIPSMGKHILFFYSYFFIIFLQCNIIKSFAYINLFVQET